MIKVIAIALCLIYRISLSLFVALSACTNTMLHQRCDVIFVFVLCVLVCVCVCAITNSLGTVWTIFSVFRLAVLLSLSLFCLFVSCHRAAIISILLSHSYGSTECTSFNGSWTKIVFYSFDDVHPFLFIIQPTAHTQQQQQWNRKQFALVL